MGDYKKYLIYLIISLIILFPLLNNYFLTLDSLMVPDYKIEDLFYGFRTPYPNTLPFFIIFKFISLIFTTAITHKIALFLALFLSAISMHNLVKTKSELPRYFAGILYMINPFVYIRFMAGHWPLVLAYAITPFVVSSIIKFFKENNYKQSIKTCLWISLAGVLNIHILFLILFVFLVFFIYYLSKRYKIIKQTIFIAVIFLVLNIFWLLPLLTATATAIEEITTQDLNVFITTRGFQNHFLHTLMLYGFWRENAYILPMSFIPNYIYFPLFIILLYLTIHGIMNCKEKYKWPILITAIIASLLAVGIAHPWFKDIFLFLFNNLYFMRGFREPHKFLALLAFAYAFFGAYGLNSLMKDFSKYKKYIFILSIILIIAYTPVMFNSFWQQLKTTDYPEDWYNINNQLNKEEQDFNVLFLPWHGYMDFNFIKNKDKRIANPARSFFNKNVIQAENIETGPLYSHSTNPIQKYVEDYLKNKDETGKTLSKINVKYILIAKEVDYKNYLWILNQTELELVNETDNFYLLKNKYKTNKFYQSDDLEELYILDYEKNSPVSYTINKPQKKYVIFTDSYNQEWKLGDQEPIKDTINVYEYKDNNDLKYKRFNVYLIGYIVSLVFFIFLCYTIARGWGT